MSRAAYPIFIVICIVLNLVSAANAQERRTVTDEESPIYPLLKAYDWNAKTVCVFQNFRGIDKPPVPLIAFCHNKSDSYELITEQAAEKNGWTVKNVRERAQRNIDAYPCRWQRFQGFMLTASGKDFSSEKLLCKDFLIEAQKLLESKGILVAAPRRTVLYAAPSDLSDESLELFKTIVSKTLDDDSYGHQKISPLIFRFDRGELVGALIVKQVEQ